MQFITKKKLDLSDLENLIKDVKEKKIDVLINNVGIGITGTIEETKQEDVIQAFKTNFFGPLEITKKLGCKDYYEVQMKKAAPDQKPTNYTALFWHNSLTSFAPRDGRLFHGIRHRLSN